NSDLFSLGVITYQMLTGKLPYGAEVAKARTRAAQSKLSYQSLLRGNREILPWIDGVLRKAVHPNPQRRYHSQSEVLFVLRPPSPAYLHENRPPLVESNAVLFWQGVSLILALVVVGLLWIRGCYRQWEPGCTSM